MESLNVAMLAREIEQKLQEKFNDQTLCNQYAWWLIEAVSQQKKAHLIAQQKIVLNKAQLEQLTHWLEKIINKSMPIQYAIGSVPFLDLEILVEPPTLIPRPETEEMCAHLIENLIKLNNQQLNILDIGTGSGCIALSLAKAFPDAQVYATDIADTALGLTSRNAQHNKIDNVTIIRSNIFNNIPKGVLFDIIVSNPPYVSPQEWEELDDSVAQWEDRNALIAQNEGLAIFERIVKQAPDFLRENKEMERLNIPQLVLEIGHKQGSAVSRLLENAGFDDITVQKDLENKDRTITGRVKDVAIRSKEK